MLMSVRSARLLAEKTQAQMAMALGVCRDTYVKYERHPEEMPIRMAMEFSRITGVSVDALFFHSKSS